MARIVTGPTSCPNKTRIDERNFKRSGRSKRAARPVMILNATWAAATLLAFGVAPRTARPAVEVEPTLAPITRTAALSIGITPPAVAVSVIAIAALDDCITTVNKKPIPR